MGSAPSEDQGAQTLFGSGGIRGRVNEPPITIEMGQALGKALVEHVAPHAQGRRPLVLIGRDTRWSGPMLEDAVAAGVRAAGGEIRRVGVVPTPAVAYLTRCLRADVGVAVTASHNPAAYNGWKIFGAAGFELEEDDEVALTARLGSPMRAGLAESMGTAHRDDVGHTVSGDVVDLDEVVGHYRALLLMSGPAVHKRHDLRVVIDAANGAAHAIGPAALGRRGFQVHACGQVPDGNNINEGCGTMFPQYAIAEVLRTGAHVGVVLDGDADRVLLIDENGALVDGDAILAMLAIHEGDRPPPQPVTVVGTVLSNLGLERALQKRGMRLLRVPVGARHVTRAMRAGGHDIGGEPSGHIVLRRYGTSDDGLVAALQVLDLMAATGRPLSELAAVFTPWPQAALTFPVAHKLPIETLAPLARALAEVTHALGRDGRVVVRYSGTEPIARVMVEAADATVARRHAEALVLAWQRALAEVVVA